MATVSGPSDAGHQPSFDEFARLYLEEGVDVEDALRQVGALPPKRTSTISRLVSAIALVRAKIVGQFILPGIAPLQVGELPSVSDYSRVVNCVRRKLPRDRQPTKDELREIWDQCVGTKG